MRWGFALSRSRSRADGARWWWREGVRGFASVGVGVSPSARARLGWKDGDGRGTASPPLISSGDSATLRAPLAALDLHACLPGRDARLASRSPRLPSVRTHRIGLIAGQWPCIAARLVVFVAAGRHGQVRSRVVYRVRSTSFGFQTFFFLLRPDDGTTRRNSFRSRLRVRPTSSVFQTRSYRTALHQGDVPGYIGMAFFVDGSAGYTHV